mgnify:CR=1 FL=1
MEKVTFVDPQTKESIDFFVVEETPVRVIFLSRKRKMATVMRTF